MERLYEYIEASVYGHKTPIHKKKFVDSGIGVHTQNMKSYGNKQDKRIKEQKGIKKDKLRAYLIEWMVRDNYIRTDWNGL